MNGCSPTLGTEIQLTSHLTVGVCGVIFSTTERTVRFGRALRVLNLETVRL